MRRHKRSGCLSTLVQLWFIFCVLVPVAFALLVLFWITRPLL